MEAWLSDYMAWYVAYGGGGGNQEPAAPPGFVDPLADPTSPFGEANPNGFFGTGPGTEARDTVLPVLARAERELEQAEAAWLNTVISDRTIRIERVGYMNQEQLLEHFTGVLADSYSAEQQLGAEYGALIAGHQSSGLTYRRITGTYSQLLARWKRLKAQQDADFASYAQAAEALDASHGEYQGLRAQFDAATADFEATGSDEERAKLNALVEPVNDALRQAQADHAAARNAAEPLQAAAAALETTRVAANAAADQVEDAATAVNAAATAVNRVVDQITAVRDHRADTFGFEDGSAAERSDWLDQWEADRATKYKDYLESVSTFQRRRGPGGHRPAGAAAH